MNILLDIAIKTFIKPIFSEYKNKQQKDNKYMHDMTW